MEIQGLMLINKSRFNLFQASLSCRTAEEEGKKKKKESQLVLRGIIQIIQTIPNKAI
jgi:hypothetical protein